MFTQCLIFCIHELCAVYNLWMSSFSLTKTFCAWLQRFSVRNHTALSRELAELSNSYAWLFFLVTSEMWNSWSKMNGFVSIEADERDILSKAASLFQFTVQIWYLGCLWELSIRFMKWRTRINVSAFYFLFYSSKLFATQSVVHFLRQLSSVNVSILDY